MTPVLERMLAAMGGLASHLHLAEHEPFIWPTQNLAISRGVRFRSAVMTAHALYPRFAEARLADALGDNPVVLIHGPRLERASS